MIVDRPRSPPPVFVLFFVFFLLLRQSLVVLVVQLLATYRISPLVVFVLFCVFRPRVFIMESNSAKSSQSVGLQRLHALAWLDRSNDNLEAANELFKATCWHLTKARQSQRSTSLSTLAFSACNVREEIAAQYRLVEQPSNAVAIGTGGQPPALIHEKEEERDPKKTGIPQPDLLSYLMSSIITLSDEGEGGGGILSEPRPFQLVNVAKAILAEKENTESTPASSSAAGSLPVASDGDPHPSGAGLRNRRAKSTSKPSGETKTNSRTEWTCEDDADKLLSPSMTPLCASKQFMNPLELFGGALTPRELKLAQETAQKALRMYVLAGNDRRRLLDMLSRHDELGSSTQEQDADDGATEADLPTCL
jgi:hypothetical protein